MADNDDFETYESSGTYKYAQLAVPYFQIDATSSSAASSTKSGSSFFRLGSFPDTSDTSSSALEAILDGLSKSYELAGLVGDSAKLSTYNKGTDATALGEYGVYHSNPYAGDPNFRVGFIDDTRIRDDASASNLYVDGANKTSSTGNRQTETNRLLTKGGIWDHSGGNRISTTGGDKIEIVQGNYKLIVLGRQNPTSPSQNRIYVSDISGGRDVTKSGVYETGDYDFSKTYEYLSDQKMWATYAYDSPKKSYKLTRGVEVSVFTGTEKVTVTGDEPGGSRLRLSKTSLGDPKVVSKTWAKYTESYTGSFEKPLPQAYSLSYFLAKEDFSFGAFSASVKITGAATSTTICEDNFDIKLGARTIALSAALEAISINVYTLLDIRFGKTYTVGSGFTSFKFKLAASKNAGGKADVVSEKTAVVAKQDEAAVTQLQVNQNRVEVRLQLEETAAVKAMLAKGMKFWGM